MLPSWMIKVTEGWGEPKKDSEGEDDGFEKRGGGGGGEGNKTAFFLSFFTNLTHPSSTIPNSLLAVHSKWRPSNERP